MTLSEVIATVRSDKESEDGWLFIAGDAEDLSLATDCELAAVEVDEENEFEEFLSPEFEARGLWSTIDYQTLQDCVQWADRLSGGPDEIAACEVIRYYIRFDAWPERLGAPDPPPADEILARLDREFYDSLGTERAGKECRREGCMRGSVEFSAFCRIHQFENVKKKPCPFTD